MFTDNKIWMAQSDKRLFLLPNMANRHGLIAGATGTGKTITMKVMAESFSEMGVPVFLADIKGDLTGMCKPGRDSADMQARIQRFGIEDFSFHGYPTRFWDIFGEIGHPVRVTVSSMGPVLLARLLGLTEIQTGWSSTRLCSHSATWALREMESLMPRTMIMREITCFMKPFLAPK